ncbi:MAG: hypothetical protein LC749_18900 [Actinobacteria bacterium]|nr:hypothetical protein [Actinomycetota bacterium]
MGTKVRRHGGLIMTVGDIPGMAEAVASERDRVAREANAAAERAAQARSDKIAKWVLIGSMCAIVGGALGEPSPGHQLFASCRRSSRGSWGRSAMFWTILKAKARRQGPR